MEQLKYKIAALTHTGEVRDHNEDNFIVNPNIEHKEWLFDSRKVYVPTKLGAVWVVADGMGGTNAGEVASEIAVNSVKEAFQDEDRVKELWQVPRSFIEDVMIQANNKIILHGEENLETAQMGTTLVVCWLIKDTLHVSWVGDSRAYLFRNNTLSPLSKDHSLVQEMVDAGKLTEEQAFYHPSNNIITQSLGGGEDKLKPGYKKVKLYKGDSILLCSDGLNGMLLDIQIEEFLLKKDSPQKMADQLIKAALKAGGHDNITLILAEVIEADGLPAAANTKVPQTSAVATSFPKKKTLFFSGKGKKIAFISILFLMFALGSISTYYVTNNGLFKSKSEEVGVEKESGKDTVEDRSGKEKRDGKEGNIMSGDTKRVPAEKEDGDKMKTEDIEKNEKRPQQKENEKEYQRNSGATEKVSTEKDTTGSLNDD